MVVAGSLDSVGFVGIHGVPRLPDFNECWWAQKADSVRVENRVGEGPLSPGLPLVFLAERTRLPRPCVWSLSFGRKVFFVVCVEVLPRTGGLCPGAGT